MDWEAGSLGRRETLRGWLHKGFVGKRGLDSHLALGVMLLAKTEGKSNPRQIQNGFPKVLLIPLLASALPLPGVLQILGKSQKATRKRSEFSSCAQSHFGAVFSGPIWDLGPKGQFFFSSNGSAFKLEICVNNASLCWIWQENSFGAFHSHCLEMMLCHSTQICFGSPKIFPWKWRGWSSVAVAFFNLVSQINSTCCIWRALRLNTPAKNTQQLGACFQEGFVAFGKKSSFWRLGGIVWCRAGQRGHPDARSGPITCGGVGWN